MGWRRTQTKKKRKEYTGSKAVDTHCRNHGSCSYCKNNRLYRDNQQNEKVEYDLKLDKESEN